MSQYIPTCWHQVDAEKCNCCGPYVKRIKELEASLFLCEAANVNARLEGTEMRKLLERIDIKAQAGLCQMTFAGAREFLKDIRLLVLERTKP